jgi:acetyl-CoA C-acetyltransferase
VQVAAAELGLSLDRPLTVTGGLTFGGGPLNDYVLHSIARMVEVLRADPGSRGLVTANGGFLTKHAFGVYSTEPPREPWRHEDLQPEVDRTPRREAVVDAEADVAIESYTVMYDDAGPKIGHAACLLADGRRTWANTTDAGLLDEMTRTEFCGRRARVTGGELAGVR